MKVDYEEFVNYVKEKFGTLPNEAYIDLIYVSLANLNKNRLSNITNIEKNPIGEDIFIIIGSIIEYARSIGFFDELKKQETNSDQIEMDFGLNLSKPKNAWEH